MNLYNQDFLSNTLPDNSVDVIITSPPYNLNMPYKDYRDNLPYLEYLNFTREWLTQAYRVATPDGRMCLNIPPLVSIPVTHPFSFDVIEIARQVGWQVMTYIVWDKKQIHKRTAWGSFKSASAPFVHSPCELIIVMYKEQWKKAKHKERCNDITNQEFIDWTVGLWSIQPASAKKIGHPAPYPKELVKRCVKLYSFVGETILDPFAGSGTTLIVAEEHGRHAIGFEIDAQYCDLIQERYKKEIQDVPESSKDSSMLAV